MLGRKTNLGRAIGRHEIALQRPAFATHAVIRFSGMAGLIFFISCLLRISQAIPLGYR